MTLRGMVSASAVQVNGLASSLRAWMYALAARSRAATLRNTPRRICLAVSVGEDFRVLIKVIAPSWMMAFGVCHLFPQRAVNCRPNGQGLTPSTSAAGSILLRLGIREGRVPTKLIHAKH